MKKILIGAGVAIFAFFAISGGFLFYLSRDLASADAHTIGAVDLYALEDGTYTGRHEGGRFSNTVEVIIDNHAIKDIRIVSDLRFSRDEVSAEVLSNVIEAQNTDIDMVAGATVSTIAYLKAIENALNGEG